MNFKRLLINVLLWPIRCALSVLFRLPNLRRFDLGYSKGGYVPDKTLTIIREGRLACPGCGRLFRIQQGWIEGWLCRRCYAESLDSHR